MKKLIHYAILLLVLLGLAAVVFLLPGWAFPQQAKMPANHQPLRGIVPTNTPGGNVKSGEAEMHMSACNGTFGDGKDEAVCHSNIHYEYERVFYTGIIGIEDVIACYVWLPEEYVDPQGTTHPNPIPVAGENPYQGYKAGAWYLNTDGDPFGGTDSWEDCFLRVKQEDFTVLALSTKKYEEDQNGDYVRLKRYELKDGKYSEEENGYYLKDRDGGYFEDKGNKYLLKGSEIVDDGNGWYIAYGNGKYAEIDDTSYRINGEFQQELKSFVQNGQPHTAVYYLYEKEVTFRVENGSWEDGSKEEKKVALNYTTASNRFNRIPDIQRLSEKQIPKAGTNPDQGYKAGRWKKIVSVSGNPVTEDEAPDTSTPIEETEVTYVYSYEKIKDSCTVTFRVENGSWGDGTKEDKQVTLTAGEGGVFNLSAEQIPAAGSRPDQGYKAGCWPVVPDIGTTIEGDVTYTYRYAPAASEDSKVYTVTFCVENGFWGNGTSNDRNVMLTGPDTGVMMDNDQIPEAGCNPAQGYKSAEQSENAGCWKKIDSKGVIFDDADPYQLGNVTESVTYIYTYAPKNETETVTFKVVNGNWDEGGNGEKQITLTAGEGGKFKLSADQIPAVGNSPSEGCFDSGYWDIVPDTVSEIPGDTTYTFTYRRNAFDHICIFRVFGGSWNDGSTNDRMALAVFDNDTHRINFLFPEQIPKVGSLPAQNHIKEYDEKNWDVIPRGLDDDTLAKLYQSSQPSEWENIKNEYSIMYDKIFTYTYQKKEKTDYTVTCQVENGSWDNETDDPVTVRLSRYENGDPPVLKSNLIPKAGSRPAEHFEAGSWTKDSNGITTAEAPNTNTFVTADTTYTYTYASADVPPTITTQPKDLKLTYGGTTGNTLKVAAAAEEGCSLSYQWYRKDSADSEAVILENETGAAYNVPTDQNVGTTKYYYCEVTSTRTGSGTTSAVNSDMAAVTINKAAITIRADDKSSRQGEALKDLTYTVSGSYVKGDELGVTLGTDANKKKAGTYDIKVGWNKNPNYDARLVNGQYTVKRKAVPQPVLYRVSVSVQKEMEERGTVEGGGTYTLGRKVTVKAVPNEGYHFKEWMEKGESVSTDAEYTFTVTKTRSLEAVFEPDELLSIELESDGAKKVYREGDELDVTGLFLELLKTGGVTESIPVTPDMVSGFDSSRVGTQTLTVSYEDFTDSYEIEVLKKEPLPMEGVSANGYTGTYDGEKHSIEVSAPEGAVVTYSKTKDGAYGKKNPSYKNAGTYKVYYRVKKAGYKTVTGSAKVKIKKAAITIRAVNKSSKRGRQLKKLTSRVTGAYVTGDKLGIKLSTKAKKNKAGKYPITVRWNKNKNYKAKLVTGTYTVK